ncbi:ataxin-1-like isoform X2 [Stegodyphus dumicola]|nr:ataxin-1-like isoform X2 [Stegodyphus dumicola]XP_035208933.1 ataxin-1-like isoform X2 [Stegodyphus dumicola]
MLSVSSLACKITLKFHDGTQFAIKNWELALYFSFWISISFFYNFCFILLKEFILLCSTFSTKRDLGLLECINSFYIEQNNDFHISGKLYFYQYHKEGNNSVTGTLSVRHNSDDENYKNSVTISDLICQSYLSLKEADDFKVKCFLFGRIIFHQNSKRLLPASNLLCGLLETLMNGTEKSAMTGSSNPRNEQLNWLSEVASAASKGALSRHVSSPEVNEVNSSAPTVLTDTGDGTPSLLLPSSVPVFSPPVVIARPIDTSSLRMFASPFQVERTRHVQQASIPIGGSGTALYYSQAPRTVPYSNFFPATYSSATVYAPASHSVVTSASVNPPEPVRSYLQVDNYSLNSVPNISSTHPHHSCSPGYLQQHSQSASSPTSIGLSQTVSHNRLFQQGRSILISRSPEGMIVHSPHEREPGHVKLQLSPTLLQEDTARRKSFTSADSVLGSASCSPITETSQTTTVPADFGLAKEYVGQLRTSPSHVGYKLPTGKEGSLKHRILRPPSINIIDLPQSVVADAPLSAPPIRTHREPSPKQARSIPSSGYRSFSSSASSLTEVTNRIPSSSASPSGSFPNHCSSLSSGSPSPAPPSSPGAAAQLKYPQSFIKGAIIQLANNQLKQVENMTTEDFIECGLLSSTLKIDSSTVVSIEKTPSTGAAKLGFHVGQDNIQITVEAPLEHPFFVYKQGWSSCSPERSAQRYGLTCHKLKVGDVCISLTDKPQTPGNGEKKVSSVSVPIVNSNITTRKQNLSSENMVADDTKEMKSQVLGLLSNVNSPSEKQSSQLLDKLVTTENEMRPSGKRKRRWSAPDNLSQDEDADPLSS